MSEKNSEQGEVLFICSVLYSSPPAPDTHTSSHSGMLGQNRHSSSRESVSFLHILDYRRVTCMIIVDFYLAVYTVLLDKDNIMPDLKSK